MTRNDKHEGGSWGWLILLLPVLYVASIGPAHSIATRYVYANGGDTPMLRLMYRPLTWLTEQSSIVRDAITWYVTLFNS